jgi:hypothetical protein
MRALVLAASLAGLCGSALLISAAYAADPAKPYLGMSREEIVACAGEPYAKYKSGADAETLTYHYSGAGPVPTAPGEKKKKESGLAGFFPGGDKADKKDKKGKKDKEGDASIASDTSDTSDTSAAGDTSQPRAKGSGKKGKKKDSGWTCTASLVFESGRLARVSFAHKDVRSPYDWQKEKDPKKREEMRNAPLPTCTFSLPNCTRAQ